MLNDLLAKNQSSGKLYVEDVFSTYLYTGTGSSQTITTGVDLSANSGMVWIKGRSGATDHAIYDTTRGVQKDLVTNTTAAETTQSTGLTAFSSTGFTVGALAKLNTNADTYASWTFREAPNFFDVVTYTGNGGTQTINHNLGVAPGMIIVKATSTTGSWWVYHRSLGNNFGLRLELTNAATNAGGNEWSATATTFTAPSGFNQNASGVSYVAYLFAHDDTADGVIQCGSFTTDGSGNATVSLGFEPQYLIYKLSSSSGDWYCLDVMRGFSQTKNNALLPNANIAETSSAPDIRPNATGFSVFGLNPNGTHVYLAIRRGPMRVPTDATKVFSVQASTPPSAPPSFHSEAFPVDTGFWKNKTNASSNWILGDRIRGVGVLSSNNADAEDTASYSTICKFDFQQGWYNGSALGSNYPSWMLRRAPGFFDIVCYTGTGSSRTVSHNLGVAPELMIVKRRNTTGDWQVYAGAAGEYLVLNSTAAKVTSNTDRWNNTAPTSTVFSLGTNAAVNASGGTYVAYLFATCAGVSKIGSYTGTGTTLQINCGFTNGARFVLIKRTDSTGDWYVYDSARGIVAGNDPYLLLNSTAAEDASTDYVDAYSAGFELSSTAPAALNANGGTYIYLAIA